MIERARLLANLSKSLRRSRVVALVGPRQCGKTTLARKLVDASSPPPKGRSPRPILNSIGEPSNKAANSRLLALAVV